MVPTFDPMTRTLWLDGEISKQFRQPAADQEAVLRAFQEEGWPPRIDDPLPPRDGKDRKARLHEVITNLNRNVRARRNTSGCVKRKVRARRNTSGCVKRKGDQSTDSHMSAG